MAKYVVAVSGGVDSVSLLDMLARVPEHELIVAHFDHGIRDSSAEDAAFVERLAQRYEAPFEMLREELGEQASEELARRRRYRFLRKVAKKHGAKIVTAHHADDAVETVAINLNRGTGWRGLAVMDSDISRPLLQFTKDELHRYALQHGLEYREDETNAGDKYLRNRVRRKLGVIDEVTKQRILALRRQQLATKRAIEEEVRGLVGDGPQYSRYFFTHVPSPIAAECLRVVTEGTLTRPQLQRALLAIKTGKAGSKYQAGTGTTLYFTTRNFTVTLVK